MSDRKNCAANGLVAAGICPGLEASATANEQYVIFLQPYQPMALRELKVNEILSPLADPLIGRVVLIDYNVRAERMGWLPSAPAVANQSLQVVKDAEKAGKNPVDYVV